MNLSHASTLRHVAILFQFEKENRSLVIQMLKSEYGLIQAEADKVVRNIFLSLENKLLKKPVFDERQVWKLIHTLAQREKRLMENIKKKNFELSEVAFHSMREKLRKGDESLFEQVFLNHFGDCTHFLKRKYRLQREDAYDITMDTLLQFRKKIINGKMSYGNLRFAFTQMAGHLYLKSVRDKKTLKENPVYERRYSPTDLETLDKALPELGIECREILQKFYYEKVRFQELAEVYGKSTLAMRKQKQRCVDRLKMLFQKINTRHNDC